MPEYPSFPPMISALIGIAGVAIAWLLAAGFLMGVVFRKDLRALWREPVLRCPVLIIESDDWGPGPDAHAEALQRLTRILSGFRDQQGRHPVMTLGLVLAIPDGKKIIEGGLREYHRQLLADPRFGRLRSAITSGIGAGVFAPQLHGMEHYWPPALLAQARADKAVREWLAQNDLPNTELLPPSVQSRWTDSSRLPSTPISEPAIIKAVDEEVRAFTELFGARPEVVVPPTFVWNGAVERAWAQAGVRALVTPGKRREARDQKGGLALPGRTIRNGERGEGGIVYLVRNDYFEPAKGHKAEHAIVAMSSNAVRGRPTLLETHRFNFTGGPEQTEQACKELETMLKAALDRFPNIRFMSTGELAAHIAAQSPHWVETRFAARLRAWTVRIGDVPRFRKLAALSGGVLLLWGLSRLLARGHKPQPGSCS